MLRVEGGDAQNQEGEMGEQKAAAWKQSLSFIVYP